jgi:hypothetical protein
VGGTHDGCPFVVAKYRLSDVSDGIQFEEAVNLVRLGLLSGVVRNSLFLATLFLTGIAPIAMFLS